MSLSVELVGSEKTIMSNPEGRIPILLGLRL